MTNLPDIIGNAQSVLDSLPAPVKESGAKALIRLVGGLADVPASYLEQWATGIRDKTQAKSRISKRMSEAAAEFGAADPELVERALVGFMGEQYRKQSNREEVGRTFVEQLAAPQEDPGPEVATEPDEDWMNLFVRYAEDASSERMQALWGRVLAGEVRRPGAFSLTTMRVLSEIDQTVAQMLETAAKFTIGDVIIKTAPWQNEHFAMAMALEAQGLLSNVQGLGATNVNFNEQGMGYFVGHRAGIVIQGRAGGRLTIPALFLTRTGRELRSLLPPSDEYRLLDDLLPIAQNEGAVEHLLKGTVTKRPGGGEFNNLVQIWKREPRPTGTE